MSKLKNESFMNYIIIGSTKIEAHNVHFCNQSPVPSEQDW